MTACLPNASMALWMPSTLRSMHRQLPGAMRLLLGGRRKQRAADELFPSAVTVEEYLSSCDTYVLGIFHVPGKETIRIYCLHAYN